LTYSVEVAETVARLSYWQVEASSPEEARAKFDAGYRRYVYDKDIDVIDLRIVSVKETKS
jgi:hypothetical protein